MGSDHDDGYDCDGDHGDGCDGGDDDLEVAETNPAGRDEQPAQGLLQGDMAKVFEVDVVWRYIDLPIFFQLN